LQTRSNVFLAASLLAGGASLPVRMRNVSPSGALLEGISLPPVGAAVRLVRGDLTAEGEIAWTAAGQAGIRFAAEIDVPAWVRRVGHPGQQRVDRTIAALRRHEVAGEANRPALPSIAWVSAELDAICERLAGSPEMTVELGEELVRLDSIARTLHQLASR
jgi:hypothetical protein